VKYLERDESFVLHVLREIDSGHPAASKLPIDCVLVCDSVSKRLDERLTVVDPSGPEENAKFACKPDRRSRVAGRGIDQPDPVRDRVCPAPPR